MSGNAALCYYFSDAPLAGIWAPGYALNLSAQTSGLFNLAKLQFDRGSTTKNGHRNPQAILFVIDIFDGAIEIRERTFLDSNGFAHIEQGLWTRFFHPLLHLLHDLVDFFLRDRCRTIARTTNETRHLWRVFHQVPGIVIHFHFHEHITRKKLALGNRLLAAFHFNDFFDRHQNLPKLLLHAQAIDSFLDSAHHALFETGIGMHD